MHGLEVQRAVTAVKLTAKSLGLVVEDALILQNSNKLALRLLPCDAFARVAPLTDQVAQFEIELARKLGDVGSPAAVLEPRVPHRVFERDGFAITFWTYYESMASEVEPADYAFALSRLHTDMRTIEVKTPHFTDRVVEAEQLVENREQTPELTELDRTFLGDMLKSLKRSIVERGVWEQMLHGEPHPGNVLSTKCGPLFIDLETCCRGPIEFDLAHVPEAVSEHYPAVDQALLSECRALVLAMVAAWRSDAGDQFPNGRLWAELLIYTLRKGAPWPSLQVLAPELEGITKAI